MPEAVSLPLLELSLCLAEYLLLALDVDNTPAGGNSRDIHHSDKTLTCYPSALLTRPPLSPFPGFVSLTLRLPFVALLLRGRSPPKKRKGSHSVLNLFLF